MGMKRGQKRGQKGVKSAFDSCCFVDNEEPGSALEWRQNCPNSRADPISIQGLEIKAFNKDQKEEAEAWLSS